MGNRKTKNLKQEATSPSTCVRSEDNNSIPVANQRYTKLERIGTDGSSIRCELIALENVRQLLSFLKTNVHVKNLYLYLSYSDHPGNSDLLLSIISTFSNSEFIENLRLLSVSGRKIGSEGIKLLIESKYLNNLMVLKLRDQFICDEGIKSLAISDIISKVTELDLSGNEVSNLGVKALLSSNNLKVLVELYLGNNKISDEGLQYFVEYDDTLNNLAKLDLSKNKISSKGIKAISTSKTLMNLSYIDISNTEVDFDGIETITTSQHMANLEDIVLGYDRIDLKGSDSIDLRSIAFLAKQICSYDRPFARFCDYTVDRSLEDKVVICNIRQDIYSYLIDRCSPNDDILSQATATEMFLDMARDDSSGDSVRYIINNYNKLGYRFLINFKDDEGNSLSSLYARSIKMQRFLLKNGMVPQSFHGEDILSEENILLLTESLSELIVSYVEKNIEFQGALKELISGSLDVTKPEGITFNQQVLLSKINREISSRITYHSSHPNYSIGDYDVPLGYSKPMISVKEYGLVIEELKKVKNLQEYEPPTSSIVDTSSELATNTSRKL